MKSNPNSAPAEPSEAGSVQRLVSPREGASIAEELERAANIVARYYDEHQKVMPANVCCALTREMTRLRELARKINPPTANEDEG